ncbi:lysophospholipid acyltransferase family protein [Mycolicibacterium tusciae]|uniref:lysophospholipid acyltransferase family protein n=1 Tax=Mycolicibacterium tusciae TaxID=75922 RepID=UPI00024A1A0F|nr:lysophospholipid acyltransferase family protein [Mycolicibacterium tusciae]
MNTLHALNPWYIPGPGDFLHRSAMHGHTPELFNNGAILLNAAPGATRWLATISIVGLLLIAVFRTVRTGRFGATTRHYLWRIVVSRSGGLTVTGRWGHAGGCILVANHSSHADTAALLAALPPSAKPVFVAAADYWFDVPVRRFALTSLAGGLPVRRSGGSSYAALLAAVKPALAQGRTVVIYPEGTRSTNGHIGEFRSGAIHLAKECGVPVVPVALLGTADVLPKGGRLTPNPMEVRIGAAMDPADIDAAQMRREVLALRNGRRTLTNTGTLRLVLGIDRRAVVQHGPRRASLAQAA